jgi:hypothetical protein
MYSAGDKVKVVKNVNTYNPNQKSVNLFDKVGTVIDVLSQSVVVRFEGNEDWCEYQYILFFYEVEKA